MIWAVFAVLLLGAGIILAVGGSFLRIPRPLSLGLGTTLAVAGLASFAMISVVWVGADGVGHLKRVYGGDDLPAGRIVGLDGQKGPQARVLGPGFHFLPLVRVLYDVEEFPVVTVASGTYGRLTTRDGRPMPGGMFIAPRIPDERVEAMLVADEFLSEGGYRGPQETVLKPGSYRLNRYLFDVSPPEPATVIPAGHVGVVKSNVADPSVTCVEETVVAEGDVRVEGALAVPLVPRGCVGIWRDPLFPGAYYLNREAYDVTLVDTRVQTWEYKGGYTKRLIDLSVDQEGDITQTERQEPQPVPENAADRAVFAKMEGWDIPLELRVNVQVDPENAPVVVGSVGGLAEIEDRILTPVIRSVVRNVTGSSIKVGDDTRPTRVLDLVENRDAIESTIERFVKVEGAKAGVDIREIRLGEPAIPPELLVSRLRQQLADQLQQAYQRETEAQVVRTETEKARATATEQPKLVSAQIDVQVAEQRERQRAAEGRAERAYLEEVASGQRAQVEVLGEDKVLALQALTQVLESLERRPELVQIVGKLVPNTVVGGDGGGTASLVGAAAVFGQALGGGTGTVPVPSRETSGSPPAPRTTPAPTDTSFRTVPVQ